MRQIIPTRSEKALPLESCQITKDVTKSESRVTRVGDDDFIIYLSTANKDQYWHQWSRLNILLPFPSLDRLQFFMNRRRSFNFDFSIRKKVKGLRIRAGGTTFHALLHALSLATLPIGRVCNSLKNCLSPAFVEHFCECNPYTIRHGHFRK